MQPRAEEFLHLLNQLDDHLKQRVRKHEGRGFMLRLDIAARQDQSLQRWLPELREYAELRNAIVHYHEFPVRIIAEPSEETLDRLREIVTQILDPPTLLPRFAAGVKCFGPDDPLLDALQFMDRRGHSQLPVFDNGRQALLTAEGVGRWLAANTSAQVDGTTIGAVLPYEKPGSFIMLPGKATVEQARQAFQTALREGRRLRAVLISADGKPGAKLAGIVTAADLLEQSD